MSEAIKVIGACEHPGAKDLKLRNLVADYFARVLVQGRQLKYE